MGGDVYSGLWLRLPDLALGAVFGLYANRLGIGIQRVVDRRKTASGTAGATLEAEPIPWNGREHGTMG